MTCVNEPSRRMIEANNVLHFDSASKYLKCLKWSGSPSDRSWAKGLGWPCHLLDWVIFDISFLMMLAQNKQNVYRKLVNTNVCIGVPSFQEQVDYFFFWVTVIILPLNCIPALEGCSKISDRKKEKKHVKSLQHVHCKTWNWWQMFWKYIWEKIGLTLWLLPKITSAGWKKSPQKSLYLTRKCRQTYFGENMFIKVFYIYLVYIYKYAGFF